MQGSVIVNSPGMGYGLCCFLEVDVNGNHSTSYSLQVFEKSKPYLLIELGQKLLLHLFFFIFPESQTCFCLLYQTGI